MFRLLTIAPLLLLAGCSVGNKYEAQNFITDEQVADTLGIHFSNQNINNTWYTIFKDTDLNTLLMTAYNNNFDIKQGVERLQQARYKFLINSKQSFPMFDALGEYDYAKSNTPRNVVLDSNLFKVGFDASWEIDVWGRGQYVSEQYFQLLKSSQYSLYSLYVSLSAEIIVNYVNAKKTVELLRVARQNLKLQTEILQTVIDKNQCGIADDLALNQAQQTVAITKAQIPILEDQFERYKNALAVLVGVIPSKLPVVLQKQTNNLTAKPFKYNVTNMYNLPLSIIRSRPDIMMSETKIYQQNAAVNEAIANLYPNVSLSASFAYLGASGHSLFQTDNQYYSYSPSLTQPIWHWQQLKNNVELQKHSKEEYVLQYNEAMLTALMELKNAIYKIVKIYENNKQLVESVSRMQNIMTLTYDKYKNGLVDFTEVAHAEQNLLEAQNKLISSNADILVAIVTFYKATGGGYNVK